MLREMRLVALKDLRIETRVRVGITQILPFALAVLVLFAFALDTDQQALRTYAPGLFWVTVLLAALLAIGRSFAVDLADGITDRLLLSGIEPQAAFFGKAAAIAIQLVVLEVLLGFGVVLLFDVTVYRYGLLVSAGLVAALGLAAAGTLYGALVAGLGVRESLLPLLVLPVTAPVLIGATRAFQDAFGVAGAQGWAWLGLLVGFAAIYGVFGALSYGILLEEA
ncbi:MAG: heme exporter protein CcmB [bacterium]|nr:heme exporter protein CcmB [bacterium]MCY4163731.1 heme exporter protein CcmB [bacterium]MCY4257819.1 heme exporter protein CcmB [bacterium]